MMSPLERGKGLSRERSWMAEGDNSRLGTLPLLVWMEAMRTGRIRGVSSVELAWPFCDVVGVLLIPFRGPPIE
jgi:hypothetical protein